MIIGENTLFVKRLKTFLSDDQVKMVLEEMDKVCNDCWDGDTDCQCWNDD